MNQCMFVSKIPAWTLNESKSSATSTGAKKLKLRVPVKNRVKRGDDWENESIWIPLTLYGGKADTFLEHVNPNAVVSFTCKYNSYEYNDSYYHEFVVATWEIESWGDSKEETDEDEFEDFEEFPESDIDPEDDVPF